MEIRRNEIYFADLGERFGSEQAGIRPVLILQNDKGNLASPTTIVAPFTKENKKIFLPTHISIQKDNENNLVENSILLLEQIKTIDKTKILKKVGKITDAEIIKKINKGLCVSLGIYGKNLEIL